MLQEGSPDPARLVPAASASPCAPAPEDRRLSRAEVSAALVLRYFEMWNTGRGADADALVGPTYVEHAHPDYLGPAALRSIVPRLHALYPGVVVFAEVVAADAEYVAVRTRSESGSADGHPHGPRTGVALFRVADGRLAEQWSWYRSVPRP